MLPVLSCFVGTPINLTGGIFITGTGLSASILSFVNRTTGQWSATYFSNDKCAAKDTSVDSFSTSFSIHNYVALLYHKIKLYYHIILDQQFHITNFYFNNSACHLCTTGGTLDFYSKYFCSPLKLDNTLNSDPHK